MPRGDVAWSRAIVGGSVGRVGMRMVGWGDVRGEGARNKDLLKGSSEGKKGMVTLRKVGSRFCFCFSVQVVVSVRQQSRGRD